MTLINVITHIYWCYSELLSISSGAYQLHSVGRTPPVAADYSGMVYILLDPRNINSNLFSNYHLNILKNKITDTLKHVLSDMISGRLILCQIAQYKEDRWRRIGYKDGVRIHSVTDFTDVWLDRFNCTNHSKVMKNHIIIHCTPLKYISAH